ncbi:MAG: glutamate 5-kinase [Methylophilaceae bacterium]
MMNKFNFTKAKKIIIKLGSSIITNDGKGIDEAFLSNFAADISLLAKKMQVVIVSSGAIAAGLKKLGISRRPSELSELQAAAAVGQMDLIRSFEKEFSKVSMICAQVLLTHDDLSDRKRYLNARSTLNNLLEKNVIPIINENDTVSNEEIKFGDNDNLAALTANLLEADYLILLTDQDGLYSDDPRKNSNVTLLSHISVNDKILDEVAKATTSSVGRGGMYTKILAARRASLSGTHTIIANGKNRKVFSNLLNDSVSGTFIQSEERQLDARKKWLAGQLKSKGTLIIDDGATNAIVNSGKSLLSVGITDVKGKFDRGDLVQCISSSGQEVAKGLINYSSSEVGKVLGQPSDKMESLLGYVNESSVIHRNNLVVLKKGK